MWSTTRSWVEERLVEGADGRRPYGCDVNPLSVVLCEPRLRPPSLAQVQQALDEVSFDDAGEMRGLLALSP